jgi:dihydroorotate dehydrogenase electron transfer subunit
VKSRRAGSVQGRPEQDVPVKATCEVLARRRDGAYWQLSLAAKDIAARARPGQFVSIAVESSGALLRRPFSIARVSHQGAIAGTVDVVFDAHGPGTAWLTNVEERDVLDVIGPLGRPFPLPQRRVGCLLVGGGYGVAPLFYLGEHLMRQGLRVDMVVGAASHERLLGVIEAKRLSATVTFTTEDGSYGTRGRVTDVLDDLVQLRKIGVVYACGPNPMLRAVSERCVELGVPVRVSVEERMACGFGVCFTCVLPVVDRDGQVHMTRSCVDGPVFDGARIAWDTSRYGAGAGPSSPPAPAAPRSSSGSGPALTDTHTPPVPPDPLDDPELAP